MLYVHGRFRARAGLAFTSSSLDVSMTLSSDFQTAALESENVGVGSPRSGAFLDRFFLILSPLTGLIEKVVRWYLLTFVDPEKAHNITLRLLPLAAITRYRPAKDDERLKQRVFGLNLRNPVGVAAGVDKDAERVSWLLRCGFGSVEVGTVTPIAQSGNPSPRAFRLLTEKAIINRFGFNNDGAEVILRRLANRAHEGGVVGVNIGANKDSVDRVSDYVELVEKFSSVASYITINVSSPNTVGLRSLQSASALDDLLQKIMQRRDQVQHQASPKPVLLKIAPDLKLSELDDIVAIARQRKVDGMIVSNTTTQTSSCIVSRKNLEIGGLSGAPLFKLSTRILAETYVRAEGAFPIVGVGGIDSGQAAVAKIRAGANTVQLYSGLAFYGLDLVAEIKRALLDELEREKLGNITELVGVDAATITAEDWPV
jgi:dihydroorotate dehydrogenase